MYLRRRLVVLRDVVCGEMVNPVSPVIVRTELDGPTGNSMEDNVDCRAR